MKDNAHRLHKHPNSSFYLPGVDILQMRTPLIESYSILECPSIFHEEERYGIYLDF
jgi:hypothetical protein